MKIREVGDLDSGVVAGVCQNIAINNTLYDNMTHHPAWMSQVKSNRLSVAMSVQTLLTTGDSIPHNRFDQIAFCKA